MAVACPNCHTETVTIGERTFSAQRPCSEHRPPTPVRSTVSGKDIRSKEDALEEFYRFHRAHNGGRRTDPVDLLKVESVERIAECGYIILYQVPARMRA